MPKRMKRFRKQIGLCNILFHLQFIMQLRFCIPIRNQITKNRIRFSAKVHYTLDLFCAQFCSVFKLSFEILIE